MIAQLRAKIGGDRFRDLDSRKLDGALSERLSGQRRNGEAAGLSAVEERLDLPVSFHSLGKAQSSRRSCPGLNTGPTRGKMPEGWTSAQGVRSDKCCRFNSASRGFEIIVHQHDRQVGGALDDANAQPAQGGPEFGLPLHVD